MFIQKQTAEKMPEIAYQDSILRVEVGIRPQDDGIVMNNTRIYSNCIKITASSANTHFIQFVTRQTPDLFNYKYGNGVLQWDGTIDKHYMHDSINPKWKIDVTSNAQSCFYEQVGLHLRGDNFLSIYDYPGGNFEPLQERSIFCTFVMMDNHITHLIKWSKQNNTDEQEFYTVDAKPWTHRDLPLWTINKLVEFYKNKGGLPANLRPNRSIELAIHDEGKRDFMPPPSNWFTLAKMPTLTSYRFQRRYSV